MIKKLGVVTFGVAAGLMAAAPFASATECHESDHPSNSDDHSIGNVDCSAGSGGASGDTGAGNLAVGHVLSGNAGQLLSCNSVLNGNLSNNNPEITVIDMG